jgi:hypothetical protein
MIEVLTSGGEGDRLYFKLACWGIFGSKCDIARLFSKPSFCAFGIIGLFDRRDFVSATCGEDRAPFCLQAIPCDWPGKRDTMTSA